MSGSELTARSLESALDSVSPSLSAPPPLVCVLSLSFSKINKLKKKRKENVSLGVPGWLCGFSVQFRSGHDLVVHGFEPCVRL